MAVDADLSAGPSMASILIWCIGCPSREHHFGVRWLVTAFIFWCLWRKKGLAVIASTDHPRKM